RPVFEVPATPQDLGLRQILWAGDTRGGVRQVGAGTRHDKALLGQAFPAGNLRHLLVCVMVDFPVVMLKTLNYGENTCCGPPASGLRRHTPAKLATSRSGLNRHDAVPKVSVPSAIQGGDAVADETPSGVSDALSVRS